MLCKCFGTSLHTCLEGVNDPWKLVPKFISIWFINVIYNIITPLNDWSQLNIVPYLSVAQEKKDATCCKVSPCYLHRRNLWYEILKDHSAPCIIMGFILFVIIIRWVYLRIHFHPTVPLSHMVPLRTTKVHNAIYLLCDVRPL